MARIPSERLTQLKLATSKSLQDAKATGDPFLIASAQSIDDQVDDLIRRNGQLDMRDLMSLAALVERVARVARWIKRVIENGDWPDIDLLL